MKQSNIQIVFVCVSMLLIALIVGITIDRQKKREHTLSRGQDEVASYGKFPEKQIQEAREVKKDTAFAIPSFLRKGITYIDKSNIKLIDYNYYPPQVKQLNSITVNLQGNKATVGTDCYITHTIQAAEYWNFEISKGYISKKLAVLKTDKGEIRIAEGSLFEVAIEVKYGNYKAISKESVVYCRLQGEEVDNRWYYTPMYIR